MSGFLVTRRRDADDTTLRRRGPDATRTLEVEGYRFTHYLSRVPGEPVSLPFADGDVVLVFDGAIYGLPPGVAAAPAILRLYREHGEDFARHLDGEFAVALYDFKRRIAIFADDPFGSKPVFVNGTAVASYRSALRDGERLAPDTMIVVDLDSSRSRRSVIAPFDFDHQDKESYDDCVAAFEQAVRKRAAPDCYLPLSAGYDSGAIDCALAEMGIAYKAYSIAGGENAELLARRNRAGEILHIDKEKFAEWEAFLARHEETASFRVPVEEDDGRQVEYDPLCDDASCGLALIHSLARAEGRKISLSGASGDFVGHLRRWPKELRPWRNFAEGWGSAYLGKEEFVAGIFGVEVRYPFLDRAMVQEFLWLTPEQKSRYYKAPLHEYMTRCGYPFDENVKTGFEPLTPAR